MLKDKLNKINSLIGGGLARKFVIWIAVIIMLMGALTMIFVQMNLTETLSEELRERGQVISRNLAASSVESLLIEDNVNLKRLVENIKKTENDVKYIYITDAKGKVLAHTFEGGFPGELLSLRTASDDPLLLDTGEGYVIDFNAPILGGRAGFVHIGMDEKSLNENITRTGNVIIALTIIVGIIGVLMAYIAGNYLIKPIHALVKGTEEIGRGNLGYQIETGSTDEIHILSKAFNQMSNNLNNSINELRTSEKRYKKLVDGISDAVILIDSQKKIISWNRAAHGIFGWNFEEVVGKRINILYSFPSGAALDERGEIPDGEYIFNKKNGQSFSGVVRSKPLQEGGDTDNVIVIRDVTDQKEKERLEKQLLQSDKLATIGQLASGVAHEINNPIANISLYTQMLLKKTKDEHLKGKLRIINDEANRAAHIVKGLLEFAHQSEPELSPIEINKEIEKVLNILNPRLEDIKVKKDLQPLPRIPADGGQVRQVIMNMLANSIQAITKNGEIIIKTRAKHDHLEISISDNGCGIPKENLGKIFDPFFTTKDPGQGTGLGLSICYGIIKRHNGSIDVKSEAGKGTIFKIKLPVL